MTAIILTNRRRNCCWGPCIGNPRFRCCNPCNANVNYGTQGENQNGHHNNQNYNQNTQFNVGDQGSNQGGSHNTQTFRKREWMSESNQLE